MRGSSGPRGKADEKSRKVAKIDKAKELVEHAVKVSNTELLCCCILIFALNRKRKYQIPRTIKE